MKYYVYEYWIDGVPEYVGKGTNNTNTVRATQHLTARAGSHWLKHLSKSVREGRNIQIKIVATFEHEGTAFNEEIQRIKNYGRRDLGTGTLYNLTEGGEGISNLSEETRSKMSTAKLSPTTASLKTLKRLQTLYTQMIKLGASGPKPVPATYTAGIRSALDWVEKHIQLKQLREKTQ